jgi:hypothetical protein
MSRAIQIQSLFEEIYGKISAVYHRSKDVGASNIRQGNQFRVGGGMGALYGPAVYATYDLESQLQRKMLLYGDYIIKARVNLDNFVIFDPEVSRKVYPGLRFTQQLERVFGISRDKQIYMIPPKDLDALSNLSTVPELTSEMAKNFFVRNRNWVMTKTRGMVFTGKYDGKVVVVYRDRDITPMSVAYAPEGVNRVSEVKFESVEKFSRGTLNQPTNVMPTDKNPSVQFLKSVIHKIALTLRQKFNVRQRRETTTIKIINKHEEIKVNFMWLDIPPQLSRSYRKDDLEDLFEQEINRNLPSGFDIYSGSINQSSYEFMLGVPERVWREISTGRDYTITMERL